ncbi:T-complex protein 1 subunit gamma [Tanacetum coccineum]
MYILKVGEGPATRCESSSDNPRERKRQTGFGWNLELLDVVVVTKMAIASDVGHDNFRQSYSVEIVVTNGWNATLRQLDIAHPAAKVLTLNEYIKPVGIKSSLFTFRFFNDRTKPPRDEEVGHGTTLVIVVLGSLPANKGNYRWKNDKAVDEGSSKKGVHAIIQAKVSGKKSKSVEIVSTYTN